jgi:hypothetical protein
MIGAHLVTPRTRIRLYDHHGIYVENEKVIHFWGMSTSLSKGPLQETSLDEFRAGQPYTVLRHLNPKFSGGQAAQRAREALGKPSHYNLIFNNCEHFVNWCIEGDAVSFQVERLAVVIAGLPGLVVVRGHRLVKSIASLIETNESGR